jgi:hypothetical protein
MTSEDVVAPEKWPLVCKSAARNLQSLPNLTQVQVIVFSSDVAYPLGKPGEWLDYNPATSPAVVERNLLKVAPRGGTDLHAGLKEAFKFRDKGLEAIYFFSDGLPNQGPGIPEDEEKRFSALERTSAEQAKLVEGMRGKKLGDYLRKEIREKWNAPKKGAGQPARVRIESIGFFYESPDLGSFLWGLSRENNGGFVGMSRP